MFRRLLSLTRAIRALHQLRQPAAPLLTGLCPMILVGSVLIIESPAAAALKLDEVRSLLEKEQHGRAIDLLVREIEENPAHEAARVLLAETYELAGKPEDALKTWQEIMVLSRDDATLQQGRRAISRLQRAELDMMDRADPSEGYVRTDPFKIAMPEIDWTGLEVVEDSNYLPPILPPPRNFQVPPFIHETKHFTIYSTNERLSRLVGERAEIYLAFMSEKLFGNRSWAARIPILIYRDVSDYQRHGGPVGSGGVTIGHPLSGHTQVIILFQLKPNFSQSRGRGGGGGRSGNEIWKYGIESVLPHELTHAVVNEFFAGNPTPRWMHEAIAGRFEQTRDHYGEAARLARKVVAGEFFRMRDLFEQDSYPDRVALFYEQSAAVVLYLFEAGPEAMHAFLAELAAGNDHDAACAAALGIPEEGAVEEFERLWVDWMKRRYVKDLDRETDLSVKSTAGPSRAVVFQPWVNEADTFGSMESWREVAISSLDTFLRVGKSSHNWTVEEGKLRFTPKDGEGPSLLGIRMNETAPSVVQCNVQFLGSPGSRGDLFGFAQLDADGNDSAIQVIAPLRDNSPHTVTVVWADDLALYIDGRCVGRYPAQSASGNDRYVDHPLAFVAHGPVEIHELKVAKIRAFSDKPIVAEADPTTGREGAPAGRSRSRSRSRPGP